MTVAEAPSENRQLTVLFCDLVDATRLSGLLHAEKLCEIIEEYHTLADGIVSRHGGFVREFFGDGLLSYFGWPQALEGAAAQAVRAGLEFLEAVATRNRGGGPDHTPFHVRVAVHTGPVIIGELAAGQRRERGGIVGYTSNLAARLQTIAPVGGLVMSEATHRLVPGLFLVEELGHVALKGFDRPVQVCQVLGARDLAHRLAASAQTERAPLVGRSQVLSTLAEEWLAVRAGAGRVLGLSGEPGSGKSRLLREFHRAVGTAPHRWLIAQSSEVARHSAFHPILELGRRLGLTGETSAAWNFDALRERLGELDLPEADAAVLMAVGGSPLPPGVTVPALPPEALRARGITLLIELLRRRARQMPVIFVLEDLHWADASTLEFLRLLIEGGVPPQLFVLTTERLEFRALWPGECVTLKRLLAAEAAQIVEHVAGDRWLAPALVTEIVARADGVPLFLEEITRAVVEAGGAAGDALPVPATLRDSLRARLDRLGPARKVAQLAAVLGRDFSEELLRAVWTGQHGELAHGIEQLVEAGILARSQGGLAFRHALLQAEAYESMLVRTRRALHERLAGLLDARAAEGLEIAPEMLAHHFTRAGWTQRAIPLWAAAARLAASRHAQVEAVAHVTLALELLRQQSAGEERDRAEMELLLDLFTSLAATTGYASAEIERAADRILELKVLSIDLRQAAQVHASVAACALARHRWALGEEMAHWFIGAGRSAGARAVEGSGELYRGIACYYQGRLAEADTAWQRAAEWCDAVSVFALNNRLAANGWRALCLCICGQVEESHAVLERAFATARESGRPNDLGFAMQIEQSIRMYLGDAAAIVRDATEFTAFMKDHGLSHWLAMTLPIQGWAGVRAGQIEEGLATIRRALAGFAALRQRLAGTTYHYCLVDALRVAGRPREALEALAVAEEFVRAGEIVYAPMLRCAEAGAWKDLGEREKARACLHAAREAAAAMGAWLLHGDAERELAALGPLRASRPARPAAQRQLSSKPRPSTSTL